MRGSDDVTVYVVMDRGCEASVVERLTPTASVGKV